MDEGRGGGQVGSCRGDSGVRVKHWPLLTYEDLVLVADALLHPPRLGRSLHTGLQPAHARHGARPVNRHHIQLRRHDKCSSSPEVWSSLHSATGLPLLTSFSARRKHT